MIICKKKPDSNRQQIKFAAYQIETHNATCLELLFQVVLRLWQEFWNGFTNSYNMINILPYRDFGPISPGDFFCMNLYKEFNCLFIAGGMGGHLGLFMPPFIQVAGCLR
jgi:hypothetical protein